MSLVKIGYFGDGPWSHRAYDQLFSSEKPYRPAFVVARWQAPDQALKARADMAGVPFLTPRAVNAHESLAKFAEFGADLFVSMSFDQILKQEIRAITPHGFINCHAGALPFYRGRNVLNWAIINGETRFGVTVHHVDDGIDTGDIILQRFAPIGPDDHYADVLTSAFELCATTLVEAIDLMAAGRAERVDQRTMHPVGAYFPRRGPGDEWIDWCWPSERVHNFVRALSAPGPGARAMLGEVTYALLDSRRIKNAPAYLAHEGAIVGRDASGVVVKTGDTTLAITSVAEVSADGELGAPFTPAFRLSDRLICPV